MYQIEQVIYNHFFQIETSFFMKRINMFLIDI